MARMKRTRYAEQTPCDVTEDRLSYLPWHILSIIFSYLPIIDAVKTSILAKDWRYKWLSLSAFTLDCNALPFGNNTKVYRWEIMAGLINKYLLHHTCPITLFYLSGTVSPHYFDLYHWIQYLSKQDVEVFGLQENCKSFTFIMPSPLFSFKKLKKLCLGGCALRIPSDFQGFNSLHELTFRDVVVNGDDLNRLIFICPILKKLTLINISGLMILRIHALRLEELFVDTGVEDTVIEAGPCLASVILVHVYKEPGERVNFKSHGVIRTLLGSDTIRKLGVSGDMITLLSVDFGVGNFPWRNSMLTHLELHGMNFETVEVFHVCLSLLSSCPNVRCLFISLVSAKGPRLITKFLKENQGRLSFPELISVDLACPVGVGMGCTLNFLEFIGTHSPNLKFLTIRKEAANVMNPARVHQMLARLRKRCPQASVQYEHQRPPTGWLTNH